MITDQRKNDAKLSNRWFAFSLRTLLVAVTLAAVMFGQWIRINRLRHLYWEHFARAVEVSVVASTGRALPESDARQAYRQRLAAYHFDMAAHCDRAIWRPWLAMPLAPDEQPPTLPP